MHTGISVYKITFMNCFAPSSAKSKCHVSLIIKIHSIQQHQSLKDQLMLQNRTYLACEIVIGQTTCDDSV